MCVYMCVCVCVCVIAARGLDIPQVGVICHMPICQYVIVIELDKMHVIVFSSIFPYDIRMDQIWTFNLVYIYDIR
jgi:hypothetical protein